MKKLSLPVESVRERDIDFLLVEELLSSREFVDFLFHKLQLPTCDELVNVQRSLNDFGLGETDVLVEYKHDTKSIAVLIENKLDAIFQPQQAERYTSRAEKYVSDGKHHETYSVLVAPRQYIERQREFSHSISYEDVASYFNDSAMGPRGTYKATLLKIASEKLRRGYVAVNSEPNQAFWLNYRDRLLGVAPTVSMKPVSVVPAKSDWIDLAVGPYKLVHKLEKGLLDFSNLDDELVTRVEEAFTGRTERITFKSGDVLRIQTAPLYRMNGFQSQIEAIDECFGDIVIAANILA